MRQLSYRLMRSHMEKIAIAAEIVGIEKLSADLDMKKRTVTLDQARKQLREMQREANATLREYFVPRNG